MSSERFTLAAVLALAACADLSRGEPAPPSAPPPSDGAEGESSFAADAHPLLVSACASCHASGASAGNTGLLVSDDPAADYEIVLRFVDEDTPTNSRLLSKAAGVGHVGGALFTTGSPEYQTLLAWIEGGALP